jgi:hypothetical protein
MQANMLKTTNAYSVDLNFLWYKCNFMKMQILNVPLVKSTLILLAIMSLEACSSKVEHNLVEIRGIYGHPKAFWDKDIRLDDLGVNAIFVYSAAIDEVFLKTAREQNLNVYAEFATLNGKNYVEEHPEAWPVNEKGEKAEAATWFMGVCPTDPGFKEYRMEQLRTLLTKYNIDGVWMDYVHWHAQFEDPEPILPETCFCNRCMSQFAEQANLDMPRGSTQEIATWILNNHDAQWRDWRCEVIVGWAIEMKAIIKELRPNALLGLYHCPWADEEYNGARRRILGLDYDMLKPVIDVFSPMVYHGRMERDPEWVRDNISWFCERLDIQPGTMPKVWPIVQAYDDPHKISAEEFRIVMEGGLTFPASGVMMFTTNAVADSEEKIAVMEQFYNQLK